MPNTCIISQGYTLPCSSVGGLEEVYLGNWDGAATYTFDADQLVNGAALPVGNLSVYKFEADIETAGIEQTINANRENLTTFVETNLTMKLHDFDADLRNVLVELMRAPLFAIVKSNAGLYYYAGVESAGRLTEGTASLGVQMEDMNGAELTIQWKSKNGIFLMQPSVLGGDVVIL